MESAARLNFERVTGVKSVAVHHQANGDLTLTMTIEPGAYVESSVGGTTEASSTSTTHQHFCAVLRTISKDLDEAGLYRERDKIWRILADEHCPA